jgi:predicted transcriptional regulator
MAISNELSSEIASAILVENRSPQELKELKEIILQVHTALQEMSQLDKIRRLQKSTGSAAKAPTKH